MSKNSAKWRWVMTSMTATKIVWYYLKSSFPAYYIVYLKFIEILVRKRLPAKIITSWPWKVKLKRNRMLIFTALNDAKCKFSWTFHKTGCRILHTDCYWFLHDPTTTFLCNIVSERLGQLPYWVRILNNRTMLKKKRGCMCTRAWHNHFKVW